MLTGNTGNNVLNGLAGADTMIGGNGSDTYFVDNTGDVVTEAANQGIDTISTTLTSFSLATLANVENLTFTGTASFTGTGNAAANVITGGSGNDTLDGGLGNDTLDGGAGNDTMVGGAGNDTYLVDSSADVVTEALGAGTDTVNATSLIYILSDNVENLAFVGAGNFTGTGNAAANAITGGGGNDTLNGGAGNDTLNGNAGIDTLTGGAGNDTMVGGGGNDLFLFSAGFGRDVITDFDAIPAGGQDLLDISALGITAATFNTSVTRAGASGGSTLVTIGGNTITLSRVNVNDVSVIDFRLAP